MDFLDHISQIEITNELEHAIILSSSWRSRMLIHIDDLSLYISLKDKFIEQLEDYEKIEKYCNVIDKMNQHIIEIDKILKRFEKEPFPVSAIKKFCKYELFLYENIMTDEVFISILNKIKEEERKIKTLQTLLEDVNRMWDNAETEEEIKSYIYNKIRLIYVNQNEGASRRLSENFYIIATENKNVRVFLNSTQIASLRRENYTKNELNEICNTCLEEFSEGEETIVLPCSGNHRFHPDCIIPWLKTSVACPSCRADLRENL